VCPTYGAKGRRSFNGRANVRKCWEFLGFLIVPLRSVTCARDYSPADGRKLATKLATCRTDDSLTVFRRSGNRLSDSPIPKQVDEVP
jgi:hypothetical protein